MKKILTLSLVLPLLFLSCGKATFRSDFYDAVNKEWIADNKKMPDGYNVWNAFSELTKKNVDRSIVMMDALIETKYETNTMDQKIADFYLTILDSENRNAQGFIPLKKYYDLYEKAETLADLMNAEIVTLRETGKSNLIRFEVNPAKNGYGIIYYSICPSVLDVYKTSKSKKLYLDCLSSRYCLAGETKEMADEKALMVYELEKELSLYQQSPEQVRNPSARIPYPFYMFSTLYPSFNFRAVFKQMGYPIPSSFIITDQRLIEKGATYFTEDNVSLLKAYAQAYLLDRFGRTLSDDFYTIQTTLNTGLFGYSGNMETKQMRKTDAVNALQACFTDYLGELYAKNNFSQDAKKDLEEMIVKIITMYKKQIIQTGWMNEKTRDKAIQKLNAMKYIIGYPEIITDTMNEANIKTYQSGGSCFENYCEVLKTKNKAMIDSIGKSDKFSEWDFAIYEVNAWYSPSTNTIMFPAGILQKPFYDKDSTFEQYLGSIGTIIAHEISHAFDDNGAKYDETGNLKLWWTREDLETFQEKCAGIRSFYDGIKISGGIRNNGTATLGENIADMTAMECTLRLLKETKNPDYRAFFASYASTYRQTGTKEAIKYLSKYSVHSLPKIRVNRTLSNFQEFQDTFGIVPGDPMYVKSEDRVGIW